MSNNKHEWINTRADASTKEAIQRLVDAGDYKSVSDFVEKAISEKLDPSKKRSKLKDELRELLKDPDVRRELFPER